MGVKLRKIMLALFLWVFKLWGLILELQIDLNVILYKSSAVFDECPVGIKCLGMLQGGCLGILDVLIPWILPKGMGMSSENYRTLSVRCLGFLVCLVILTTERLRMLEGLMLKLFYSDLGFGYYSLWLTLYSCSWVSKLLFFMCTFLW